MPRRSRVVSPGDNTAATSVAERVRRGAEVRCDPAERGHPQIDESAPFSQWFVLVRRIPVRTVCEHHLLPVVGVAHVGYLPGARILGLSKPARVVEHFACRPQVQERLTKQVADWLQAHLEPKGVGVVIEAEHSCMTPRGVQATGSATLTSTLLGLLRSDARSRSEFLALTRVTP
ncbi:GTP cyclohydrolase I [Streptomyces qaidamensis]|uniref:GTP cyclohydrolase I n=1 Tax=Streptomyces qaidamensis TaxID=1783515 RepID=UPI0009A05DB4